MVLVLRADFYARLAEFPDVAQLVQNTSSSSAPMIEDELRQAIEEPARLVGPEMSAAGGHDHRRRRARARNLPLLAQALLETWRRRRGGTLTLEGYRAAGGVQKGLADRAEAIYAELATEARASRSSCSCARPNPARAPRTPAGRRAWPRS